MATSEIVEIIGEEDIFILEIVEQGVPGISGDGTIVFNEIPSGLINGSNATFTTQFDFVPESVDLKINGLTQKRVDDFNTSGTKTIILTASPAAGEHIQVTYLRG